MIVLILIEGSSGPQTHSHQFVNFSSQRLCQEAAEQFKTQLSRPGPILAKTDVRAVCVQRKDAKGE
jgi:hypothetical protein